MITDKQTNILYLSDCLKSDYPKFWADFEVALKSSGVQYLFLEKTKEIWAKDFMPVQTAKEKFIQFTYSPDYLWDTLEDQKTIAQSDTFCEQIGIKTIKSDIVLEGGNIVESDNKVILTSKIFPENARYSETALTKELEKILETQVVIIPWYPNDVVGHSNCWIRFLDDDHIIISEFYTQKTNFFTYARAGLRNLGLKIIEIPFTNQRFLKSDIDIRGSYINYLQVGKTIFLPQYELPTDEPAIRKMEEIFSDCDIVPVLSSEIAAEGGALGCLGWNIHQPSKNQ